MKMPSWTSVSAIPGQKSGFVPTWTLHIFHAKPLALWRDNISIMVLGALRQFLNIVARQSLDNCYLLAF